MRFSLTKTFLPLLLSVALPSLASAAARAHPGGPGFRIACVRWGARGVPTADELAVTDDLSTDDGGSMSASVLDERSERRGAG
jgi:hypothetical protein